MASQAPNLNPSPFEVGDEQVGAIHVLSVTGELDLATAPQLEQPLEAALAAGGGILIDLSACEFIDSTGIALLVSTLSRNEGGTRVSFIPSDFPAVTRVLELTGLAERLPLAKA